MEFVVRYVGGHKDGSETSFGEVPPPILRTRKRKPLSADPNKFFGSASLEDAIFDRGEDIYYRRERVFESGRKTYMIYAVQK